jgi:hypothetical protein
MGLTQVDHFTVTSDLATVIIGGGSSGSSTTNFAINTDDVYMLTFHSLFMSVDGRVPNVRLTDGGTPDPNANYDRAGKTLYSNQGFPNAGNNGLTQFNMLSCGTTQEESQQGVFYLYNFNDSNRASFVQVENAITTETPEYAAHMGGFVLKTQKACDGVAFVANANAIANGVFTLYKVI